MLHDSISEVTYIIEGTHTVPNSKITAKLYKAMICA